MAADTMADEELDRQEQQARIALMQADERLRREQLRAMVYEPLKALAPILAATFLAGGALFGGVAAILSAILHK